jgi:hypothetical protein
VSRRDATKTGDILPSLIAAVVSFPFVNFKSKSRNTVQSKGEVQMPFS